MGKLRNWVVMLLALSGPLMGQPAYQDAILAIVNNQVITAFDVRRETALAERELAGTLTGEELKAKVIALREQAIRALIEQELIFAEFNARGAKVPEALVQERLNEIVSKQAGGNRARFEDALASQQSGLAEFEQKLRKSLAVELMRDEFVRRRVRVSPSDLLAYYQANPDKFNRPGRYRLEAIVVNKADGDAEAVQKKLQEVQRRLREGEEFAAVARALSDDRSGQRGGDLGWYDAANPPRREFAAAVQGLKAGAVAEALDLKEAIYVLRLAEQTDQTTVPFAEARSAIESFLYGSKARQVESAWMEELRQKYQVRLMQ